MTIDEPNKFYLVESGEVLKQAAAFREAFINVKRELLGLVEGLGYTKARLDMRLGKIITVVVGDKAPDGWVKPRKGQSYPKDLPQNAEILKHFTAGNHPELAEFEKWLKFPFHYRWHDRANPEGPNGSGNIGLFRDQCLFWMSDTSPILLALPDYLPLRKSLEAQNRVITEGLEWAQPEGLREILEEEWNLMVAQFKADEARAEKAKREADHVV